MLWGQQGGYTKYLCFLCLWDSSAKNEHWIREQRPKKMSLQLEKITFFIESFIPHDKVILSPLHIKLGLVKQYVKKLEHRWGMLQVHLPKVFVFKP